MNAKKSKTKPIEPPSCTHCGGASRLTDGVEIYPRREDLHAKHFYKCTICRDSYVGCHGRTKRPLGTPADGALRRARGLLHDRRFDPIWRGAIAACGYTPENDKAATIILTTARARLYAWLADRLSIDVAVCHISMFDIETCRRAWVALNGATYPEVRAWAKERKAQNERNESDGRAADGENLDRT